MEFKKVKLEDVCLLGDGAHSKVERQKNGIPYLTSKNIKQGYLDLTKVDYISKIDHSKLFSPTEKSVKDLRPGDILVGIIGTFGNVYLYKEDDYFGISSSIGILRPKKELILPEFLYFQVKSTFFSRTVEMIKGGSVQGYTNLPTLRSIPVYLPSLFEQKKILDILLNIENKIDLNKKIIKNLEQISQALFKHWFVDFEFPDEKGNPYKTSGGKLVDSELGMIPIDWKVELLHGFVDFLSGGTPKTTVQEYWNGSIPFFTPKDAKANPYTTITEKTITELGLEKCNSKLYPKNTLFITARGTVGKLALANKAMAMNQSCFALKHKENQQFYLYHVVENLVKKIILGANGAVFSAVNLSDLKHLKYTYSNENLISKFENTVSFFYDQMSLLEEENIKLQQIRDSLLPKLLSGEIKISDELEV